MISRARCFIRDLVMPGLILAGLSAQGEPLVQGCMGMAFRHRMNSTIGMSITTSTRIGPTFFGPMVLRKRAVAAGV